MLSFLFWKFPLFFIKKKKLDNQTVKHLCAKLYSKYSTHNNSFTPHKNSMR